MQRDLPASLVMTATYLGIKGTRGMQEFLPNTYPAGAVNPCPSCPSGFAYMTSNGNSTRESGNCSCAAACTTDSPPTLQYTYSKSIDDSALGGNNQAQSVIAQNWLDLCAERGLSTSTSATCCSLQIQYTTGMGFGGGFFERLARRGLFKEWTVATTTIDRHAAAADADLLRRRGTGVTGAIRAGLYRRALYMPRRRDCF